MSSFLGLPDSPLATQGPRCILSWYALAGRSLYSSVRIWELEGSLEITRRWHFSQWPRQDMNPDIQSFPSSNFSFLSTFSYRGGERISLVLCFPLAVLFVYHLKFSFLLVRLHTVISDDILSIFCLRFLDYPPPLLVAPCPQNQVVLAYPLTNQDWFLTLAFMQSDPSCLHLCCLLLSSPHTPFQDCHSSY